MTSVTERFLKYVSFDTMSNEFSETCPSTDKQKLLGAYLVDEMKAMGISDAFMDEHGYVYGTVSGDPTLPTIGLIAHMDTSPDSSGSDIKAKIVEYTGEDICLNQDQQIFLREADYPSLKNHHGKHQWQIYLKSRREFSLLHNTLLFNRERTEIISVRNICINIICMKQLNKSAAHIICIFLTAYSYSKISFISCYSDRN